MKDLLAKAPRFLFFTGKGGVGKTSMACASALGLAESGEKVLLISTDPASNLDEVLATSLTSAPTPVNGVPGLQALNINPILAAAEYRERMVGPYRGVLPEAAIAQMEEQLSGACTVEIAGFNEFSKLLGDEAAVREYDHIVLDTAPTGHTLRLLNLPAAWNDFIASSQTGSSCLGPIAGLSEQKVLYEEVVAALKNPAHTLLVLVSRPETMALLEADRAGRELRALGLANQHLIINGLFTPASDDPVARSFAQKSSQALAMIPTGLKELPTTRVPFQPAGVMGIEGLRAVLQEGSGRPAGPSAGQLRARAEQVLPGLTGWDEFLQGLSKGGRGVIMTMGKGGVGKTTMAAMIAAHLAGRGHSVLLSTTDPAAHVAQVIGSAPPGLEVDRIDPKAETIRYVEHVLACNRDQLTPDELALLEEELRSPCIEEIAVFQAFARTVARGERQFVVLDTAPTGHTLLLLDATESYHREVAKSVAGGLPEEVRSLLPRIRDPRFTKVVIVALPEATPTHEASALQADLRRAGIEPQGWIINRSFAASGTEDPVLRAKGLDELSSIDEIVQRHARRAVVAPWVAGELSGTGSLQNMELLREPHVFLKNRRSGTMNESSSIIDRVRECYGAVARSGKSTADDSIRKVAEAFGYTPEQLASIPAAANMGLSCGNPTATANLRPGETVVDLGCGGGLDVLLAAQKVGPSGRAIGIDMTPEMIERARRNAEQAGAANAQFHLARLEAIPLDDASVDCLISNCVINLAEDKAAVFREMHRVLKPGGRVAVSDIALKKPLPAAIAADVTAYTGCIAGALLIEEYERLLAAAGFESVGVVETGKDLKAYRLAEGGGCCGSSDSLPTGGCCGSSRESCSQKEGEEDLHDGLSRLLAKYDVNDYAASVQVYAVKRS